MKGINSNYSHPVVHLYRATSGPVRERKVSELAEKILQHRESESMLNCSFAGSALLFSTIMTSIFGISVLGVAVPGFFTIGIPVMMATLSPFAVTSLVLIAIGYCKYKRILAEQISSPEELMRLCCTQATGPAIELEEKKSQ